MRNLSKDEQVNNQKLKEASVEVSLVQVNIGILSMFYVFDSYYQAGEENADIIFLKICMTVKMIFIF